VTAPLLLLVCSDFYLFSVNQIPDMLPAVSCACCLLLVLSLYLVVAPVHAGLYHTTPSVPSSHDNVPSFPLLRSWAISAAMSHPKVFLAISAAESGRDSHIVVGADGTPLLTAPPSCFTVPSLKLVLAASLPSLGVALTDSIRGWRTLVVAACMIEGRQVETEVRQIILDALAVLPPTAFDIAVTFVLGFDSTPLPAIASDEPVLMGVNLVVVLAPLWSCLGTASAAFTAPLESLAASYVLIDNALVAGGAVLWALPRNSQGPQPSDGLRCLR
jgi:hypothetical protein